MKGTNINENRLFNSLGWLHRPGHGLVCQFAGWISGCRITCFMGGILCIAGLLATSFAKSPAVAHFTYGLMYGMGACFIYNSYFLSFVLIFINRRKSSSQSNSAGQEKFVTRKQQTLLLEQMWQSMTFLITKNISYHYLRFKDFFLVSTLPTFFSLLTRVFRVTATRLRSLVGSVYSNLMHAVRWRAYNLFSFEINIFENPIFVKKRW